MSCRLAAIEQSSSPQEQCAGADRADAPNSPGNLSKPLHHFRTYLVFLNGAPARDEKGIDFSAHLSKRLMRCDSQSAIRRDCCPARGADDGYRINRRRAGILPAKHFCRARKHLKRPNQIEDLGSWPGDQQNAAG
jgi:hypothetical protein